MILNELFKLQEKSTQYYYFSDMVLNAIETDDEINKYFTDWSYSQGPASDDRHNPTFSTKDFINLLTPSEIEYLQNTIVKKFHLTEAQEKKESKFPVVVGTLLKVSDYGKDTEPRKQMWNNPKGEVLSINKDGSFKIRITSVKDAHVLYAKNWYNDEQGALKYRLNLKRSEFKTFKEIDHEEMISKK